MIEDNTVFLTMDLKGLDLYERGKVIRRFINSDTKVVEDYADMLCKGILKRNGIIPIDTTNSAYNEALRRLKAQNKDIEITDFYKDTDLMNCIYLQRSNNQITVIIEDNRYLQCGVIVKEVNYNV